MNNHDYMNEEEFREYVEQAEREITKLQEKVLGQICHLTELLICLGGTLD
jgi:hypothetical protein